MSRRHPNPFQVQQLDFICHYCAAPVGVWCTERSGDWAALLHASRYYQQTGRTPVGSYDLPRDSGAERELVAATEVDHIRAAVEAAIRLAEPDDLTPAGARIIRAALTQSPARAT